MIDTVLSLLFPVSCLGCKKRGVGLCTACIEKIPRAPLLERDNDLALFHYGDPLIRKALWNYKYKHDSAAGRALARASSTTIIDWLGDILGTTTPLHLILVPIPLHKHKYNARGYNQSNDIARIIQKSLPNSRVEELLVKTVPSLPQARTHNKSARKRNVSHTMRAICKKQNDALYIIVDDVTTTGATIAEAKRALREKGIRNIASLSLAHGALMH